MTVEQRFLPYAVMGHEIYIHGREYVVTFGAVDPIGGPAIYPFVFRLGVN